MSIKNSRSTRILRDRNIYKTSSKSVSCYSSGSASQVGVFSCFSRRDLQSIYIAMTISFFVVYAIKIAILLLYKRIFSTPKYKLASNILIAISTAWFIGLESVNLGYCRPFESWTDYERGPCLNFNIVFLISSIIEILIDFPILLIPLFEIFKLNASIRTKVLLSGIFLIGVV